MTPSGLPKQQAANEEIRALQVVRLKKATRIRDTGGSGRPESHDYQLYLALNDIEHTKTKVRHPQTNGICERFHKTILQEFYQVAFRRKIYRSIEELQIDLDAWLVYYNNDRTHQGKMCCGRTPRQTLIAGKEAWHDKITTLNN